MKIFHFIALTAIAGFSLVACKKNYTIGGSKFNAQVNVSTYDYLKTNKLFDTLVIMLDKAGLKDEVNQAGTFFAVTNFSIRSFVKDRGDSVRLWLNDENYPYTFDSLDIPSLRDTLRSYMFKDRITRDMIPAKGVYRQANDGEMRLIQLLATTDYTSSVFTTAPQYLYLTKIIPWNGYPVPADSTGLGGVQPQQLLQAVCQTSGILTTTGVLHVVNNNHTFDFYGDHN